MMRCFRLREKENLYVAGQTVTLQVRIAPACGGDSAAHLTIAAICMTVAPVGTDDVAPFSNDLPVARRTVAVLFRTNAPHALRSGPHRGARSIRPRGVDGALGRSAEP